MQEKKKEESSCISCPGGGLRYLSVFSYLVTSGIFIGSFASS